MIDAASSWEEGEMKNPDAVIEKYLQIGKEVKDVISL
jgi:hypothetical protein